MTTSLWGGCHCGNMTVVFESDLVPEQIGVRADQCSFCRKHGARTVTDPIAEQTILRVTSGWTLRSRPWSNETPRSLR